ncbi:MAG: GFA family protein [Rhizobiaceae bacterium]
MTVDQHERRLAAILVADVVGYSRLMGENETATLQAMDEHRFAVVNPTVGQFHGRIVKLMGDGILVEFPSVVEAVECAVAIQRGMISRNDGIEENRQIRFRIGINLGDILTDGDDIHGDGVNIAARLQEQAEPDGVCISSTVFNHIDGKIDHSFSDAGAHQFKNIASAIRIYKCVPGASTKSVQVAFRPFIDLPVDEKPLATGGCMCGKVRYEVAGKTLGSMLCHCRMCQRFSGAPILEGTTFPKDTFRFTKGEPKIYQSSKIAERGFCGDCGTPMIFRGIVKYWTDWIVITTGSLDEPWRFPPTYHLGIESSLPWLNVIDDLPRTECKDSPSLVEAYKSVGQEVP